MNTGYRRRTMGLIPAYSRNAMLQLIIATGVAFVLYFFAILLIQQFASFPLGWKGSRRFAEATMMVTNATALPPLEGFAARPWTILTYGWISSGFWAWFSAAVWIYCWGSVVQSLVGYRQVIPLFVWGTLAGAVFYLAAQAIPGVAGSLPLLGCSAGLAALAAAAFTLAPGFRFYLGPTFSIPIGVVVIIFAALLLMNTGMQPALILWLVGGAAAGFGYVKLLQRGYRPGEWAYDLKSRVDASITPASQRAADRRTAQARRAVPVVTRRGLSQRRVDELLEKIHQKGYAALSEEEKQILVQASREAE